MARCQDIIGWRRFMEGMISHRMVEIQQEFLTTRGMGWKLEKWAVGLSVRLLEVTHGQWLYRNVMVHDPVSGTRASMRKEDIRVQIEEQLLQGGDGLPDEDAYLMKVNLDDLSTASGERLFAIKAARIAGQLVQDGQLMDRNDDG